MGNAATAARYSRLRRVASSSQAPSVLRAGAGSGSRKLEFNSELSQGGIMGIDRTIGFVFGPKVLALALIALIFVPVSARAVPSYARQTGLACEACHTVFPALTAFGRTFKASGYTLFNTLQVQD